MVPAISENVTRIKEEVRRTCLDAGRDPSDVRIMAASKYTDRAGVCELVKSGINLIGENRVQDAMEKLSACDETSQPDIRELCPGVEIHMIGNLQSNKVNHALRLFDCIDTIDRISIADALEKRLCALERALPILIEVKLTGEDTKHGVAEKNISVLMDHILTACPHLSVTGLMGMGPLDPDPETARPFYRKLKRIFDFWKSRIPDPSIFKTLSMGMSADFDIAIREGATIVRIGRALFC